MVNGQIVGMDATVLAGVVIASEDLPPAQFNPWPWPVHYVFQTDDRGAGVRSTRRVDEPPSVLDDLRLAAQDHDESPFHRRDAQRLVVLVQH